jgi:hypothetical protein
MQGQSHSLKEDGGRYVIFHPSNHHSKHQNFCVNPPKPFLLYHKAFAQVILVLPTFLSFSFSNQTAQRTKVQVEVPQRERKTSQNPKPVLRGEMSIGKR